MKKKLIKKKFNGNFEFGYKQGNLFIRNNEDEPNTYVNGDISWFKDGKYHKEDGPAVKNKDTQYRKYIVNGQFHRTDGPAYISADANTKRWYQEGELHREDGPAIESEGKTAYFLQGVRVDEKTVLYPHKLTVSEILNKDNQEEKRICIERFGWEKFLQKSKPEIIDEGENEIEQTHEILAKIDDMTVFVGACPSTGRIYVMEVPPSTRNRLDAKKYLTNKDPKKCVGAT